MEKGGYQIKIGQIFGLEKPLRIGYNTYICNIVVYMRLKCVGQKAIDVGTNTQNGDGYSS